MKPFSIVLALLVFLQAVPASAQSLEKPRYALKDDRPPTGSNIARRVVEGSAIPLNRRYAELTAAEKALVKSQYEAMADADEPPFPVDGLEPIFKAIQRGQQQLLVDGPLDLVVDVDATGKPTAVAVMRSPDPEMTKFAASILVLQAYKPAVCGGQPCRMQFPFRMNFAVRP
jgi:hypothetical protein